MKVYLDLVFFLNFCYDLLLLMTVDITLKRNSKTWRLIFASIMGALSLVILFLPFNNILLFIFKVLVSVLMIIISFGFKNLKCFITNMGYLYMCSVILGGFLYFLDMEFSYKREGLVFYFDGISVNYVLLIILSPVILFLYIKQHKNFISSYNYSYEIEICFKNGKIFKGTGFLDTGNKLKDPITNKYIILMPKKLLAGFVNIRSPIYVFFKSLNKKGMIECFKIEYIKINNQIFKNYLIGASDEKFNVNGTDCLLNYKLMEDLCLEK